MPIAKVSTKGQITLPIEIRKEVGIKTNDRVFVDIEKNRIVIKPVFEDGSVEAIRVGGAGSFRQLTPVPILTVWKPRIQHEKGDS